MKRKQTSTIVWGIVLIAIAVLLLLNALGVKLGLPTDISPWRLLLGAGCVIWVLNELIKLNIPGIFFPLTFIVMLFEREIANALEINEGTGEIASTWLFLLVALLLTVGTSMLLPRFLKGHSVFSARINGKIPKIGGRAVQYIDSTEGFHETVENNMSTCEVFFTNVASYMGNGTLTVENNMGCVIIHVPDDWYVSSSIENNMGSVKIPHQSDGVKKHLNVCGDNNMGSVVVEFYKAPSEEQADS